MNKINDIMCKFLYKKYKYFNGTRGVISIFLALLLVPFTSIAGALINAARINSAVAIFDEALCNASNSTLGTYDEFLKKRFGLLAMSQDVSETGNNLNQYTVSDLISETFSFYLEENLKTLSNTYITSESESMGVYPLADTDVLMYQVLEYGKYSVPAKLVTEGLSIEDLLRRLENSIPGFGYLDFCTSILDLGESIYSCAQSFDELKKSVEKEEQVLVQYNNLYNSFSNNISNYQTTKQQMEMELGRLKNVIDTESAKLGELGEQIKNIESQIQNLQIEQTEQNIDHSEEIEALNNQLKTIEENNSKQLETLNTAKQNYENKKAVYENQLIQYKNAVAEKKNSYAVTIDELISCLIDVEEKLTKTQNDIASVGTGFVDSLSSAASATKGKIKAENKDKIDKLEEELENTTDKDKKAKIQEEIDSLNKENDTASNVDTVASAVKDGVDGGVNSLKVDISSINVEIYSTAVSALRIVKTNVTNYDIEQMSSINENEYYVNLSNILTYDQVVEAEKNIVSEFTSSAIWSLIKAIAGFIEALFSVSLVYDAKLSAVIDMNYYSETYGGLPSTKDRNAYPLNYGEKGDAELSEYYKSIFGDYSSNDTTTNGDMDILSLLVQIFTDVGNISTSVTNIQTLGPIGFFMFATHFKDLCEAGQRIVDNLKMIISYMSNIFTAIGNKILLSGYINYMTSDRITYGGSALNGTSFNERGKNTTMATGFAGISDFMALVSTWQKTASGGTDKSFVGAEKEYIMFGSTSEIANQAAAFGSIYIFRLVANIAPILLSAEVATIAAASTIAAPIVYILYILIEPLADAVILVNGAKVPFIKSVIYLTPSGLNELLGKFSDTLNVSTIKLEDAKKGLVDALDANEKINTINMDKDQEDKTVLLDMSYSQALFIIMTLFCSREKMLNRLSNIIEMEAVEYMSNKVVGSNGKFDLDYSYTYIRTNASFSTNEFIKLSESDVFKPSERVIYRGY